MNLNGSAGKQGMEKALGWLVKQQYQKPDSLEASAICDSFEQVARRVPRNICADPQVEAKKAVSETVKSGLSGLKKSLLNCVAEADCVYMTEYAKALAELAGDYLGLLLEYSETSNQEGRNFQLTLLSENHKAKIILSASCPLDGTGEGPTVRADYTIAGAGSDQKVRAASDYDLSRFLAKP